MSIKFKFLTAAASAAMIVSMVSASAAQQQPAAPQGDRPAAEGKGKGPGRHGRRGYGPGRGGMRGRMMKPGMRRGPGGIMGEFRGLDLTQAQRDQIRGIVQASRPSDAVREEMRSINRARRDGTITEAQKTRAKELMDQGRAKMESTRQSAYAILTAEQKAKLDARKNKMNERRDKMRQRREDCKQNPGGCQGPPPRPRG